MKRRRAIFIVIAIVLLFPGGQVLYHALTGGPRDGRITNHRTDAEDRRGPQRESISIIESEPAAQRNAANSPLSHDNADKHLSAWMSPRKKITPEEAAKRPARAARNNVKPARKKRRRTVDELLSQLYVRREMVVRFRDSASAKEIEAVLAKLSPEKKRRIGVSSNRETEDIRIYKLRLAASISVREGLAIALGEKCVKYAEPNYLMFPALTPNDPYYSSSGAWGNSYPDLWGVHKMECSMAWEVSTGTGTVVAVTDSGADMGHEDLAASLWTNPGEIAGNGIDDDSNGYIDDVHGWDFANHDNDPTDTHGHGTHVSGTIAAAGNNFKGIIGVAFSAKIMALRGIGDGGTGSEADLADCIYYAANNGARVINASWGAPGDSWLLGEAINYAHDTKGCVFVAAAGNDDMDASGFFPARHPNAITVSATDQYDSKAYFSNWGNKIDVAAPGMNILSLRAAGTSRGAPVDANHTRMQGTSMAAPHVAGLCALIMADNPSLGPEEVRQIVRDSADDIGDSGFDIYYGYGRINANTALGSITDNGVAELTYPTLNETVQGTISVSGTATADNFADYELEYGQGAVPSGWTTLATGGSPVSGGTLHAGWDTTALTDGYYTLRLTVNSTLGRQFVDSVGFEVYNAPQPITVTVSPSIATILAGEKLQFTAVTTGAVDSSYTWLSEKDGVATIDSAGEATGISLGSTTITATGDQSYVSGSATLNVVEPYVEISPSVSYLAIGGNVDLDAQTHNDMDTAYAWSSTNTSVATVDASGFVSAVGAGHAVIYANGDLTGLSGAADIHVSAPYTDIDCAAVRMLSSADSSHMYVLSYSTQEVLSVNVQTRAIDSRVTVSSAPSWMDISEDDSKLYVANSGEGTISVIDTGSFAVTDTIATPVNPLRVACGKGDWLYFTPADPATPTLYMVDASTHGTTPVMTLGVNSTIELAVSADRNTLFISYDSAINQGAIEKFDISAEAPNMEEAQTYDAYTRFTWAGPGDILITGGDAYFGYYANAVRPSDLHRVAQMNTWHVINAAAFSASHNLAFVASGGNKKLQSFDLGTFTQVDTIELEEIVSYSVDDVQKDPLATTRDGRYLFAILDHDPVNKKDRLQIVDISANSKILVTPGTCYLSAADTFQLAASTISGIDTGYAWNSANPAVATVSAGGNVTAVAPGTAEISVVGNVSGSEGRCTVRVSDPAAGRWLFNTATRIDRALADPVRERMYFTNISGNKLLVADTQNPAVIKEIFVGSHPSGMAVTDDGSLLYVAVTGSQKIVTIDLATLVVTDELELDFCPGKIAFYADQKLITASETKKSTQTLYVVDLGAGTAAGFDSTWRVERMIVSPDKEKLYVLHTSIAQGFMEYDLTTPAPTLSRDASGVAFDVLDIALGHDGTRIFVAYDNCVETIDLSDLSSIDTLDVGDVAEALAADSSGGRAFAGVSGLYYDYLHILDLSGELFQSGKLKSAQKMGRRGLCLSRDETTIVAIGDPDTGYFECDCIEMLRLPGGPSLGAVEGYVEDINTAGRISGATVKIESGAFSRIVYTDAAGYFRITELEPGSYKITFLKGGYVEVVQVNVGITAGTVTVTTTACMEPDILKIVTSALPKAYITAPYSASLDAVRGAPPYTWARHSGTMPPGTGISSNGTISGTPIQTGTYAFTAMVTDADTAVATMALSISVLPPAVTINGVSRSVLGPGVPSTGINWQSAVDGAYRVELGGDGSQGSGVLIETGSCLADIPVDTLVYEADVPNNTVQNVYIIVDNGPSAFFNRVELTDDHMAPACTVFSPSDGSIRGSVESIIVRATDAGGSSVASVEIRITDGTNYYDPGTGAFDSASPVWIPLSPGSVYWTLDSSPVPWTDTAAYTIQSTATDAAGNTEPFGASATFTFDSAVPVVTINSVSHFLVGPAQDSTMEWVSDSNGNYYVEIAGAGTPGSGIEIASGTCNASAAVDTSVLESHVPDNGAIAVWVIVDSGGNVGNEAVLISDDHTAPVSAVTQPVQGASLSAIDAIAGTASDAGGGMVEQVEVSLFDGWNYYNPGSGDFTSAAEVWLVADGTRLWSLDTSAVTWIYSVTYTARSRATDGVGNAEPPSAGNLFTFTGNPPGEEPPPKKSGGGGCALAGDGSAGPAAASLPAFLVIMGLLLAIMRRNGFRSIKQ